MKNPKQKILEKVIVENKEELQNTIYHLRKQGLIIENEYKFFLYSKEFGDNTIKQDYSDFF